MQSVHPYFRDYQSAVGSENGDLDLRESHAGHCPYSRKRKGSLIIATDLSAEHINLVLDQRFVGFQTTTAQLGDDPRLGIRVRFETVWMSSE